MTEPTDLKITLAILDETARAAYRTMRGLGLSVDAAKDALTVHVSDLVTACQREHDGLPTPYDDGDGGIRAS